MKKNSDKSHSSIGMFPHRFGCFLPSVTHLASEKLILPNFSMLRGVAVSVCFPEVRNRKQTESGLPNPQKKLITIQLKISSALQSGYVTQFVADKLQYIQQSQFRSAIYRHCPT